MRLSYLVILLLLIPFSLFADRFEKEKIVVSNDFIVASNFYCNGTNYNVAIDLGGETKTNWNQIGTNIDAGLTSLSNRLYYSVLQIQQSNYNISIDDNLKTIYCNGTNLQTFFLPTIDQAPFGFSIGFAKGTNYLQIVNTNAGGQIYTGTNIYSMETNQFYFVGLVCVSTNLWVIDRINGDWSIK